MSLRIERTRVGQHYGVEEEGDCQHCGSPMYLRDLAWMIMDGNQLVRFAYCSRTCCQSVLDDLVASGVYAERGGAR